MVRPRRMSCRRRPMACAKFIATRSARPGWSRPPRLLHHDSILAIVPLVEAGAMDRDQIVIDSKSGMTGAGRTAEEARRGLRGSARLRRRPWPERVRPGPARGQAAGDCELHRASGADEPQRTRRAYLHTTGGAGAAELHRVLHSAASRSCRCSRSARCAVHARPRLEQSADRRGRRPRRRGKSWCLPRPTISSRAPRAKASRT